MSDIRAEGEFMYGCGPGGCCSSRSFLTKEEKIEMLQEYKQSLEQELKGISERISELKKNN